MRHLVILLDTSGSVALEGVHKVAQVNDLIRDLLTAMDGKASSVSLVIYSDIARLYWSSGSKEIFRDIPEKEFDGRSNLGKAYTFVKDMMLHRSLSAQKLCMVLISDGEATDNYLARLRELDPKQEATRVAGAIGINRDTLEYHIGTNGIIFSDVTSLNDRDEFFDEISNKLIK